MIDTTTISNETGRPIRFGKLASQNDNALEELLTASLHAKQLGQLRQGDRERSARFETEQDCLADEVDERAEPQNPRDQAHDRDQNRSERSNGDKPRRIASGHVGNCHPHEHRDRRRGSDRELTRGPEQRIGEAADQIAIDTVLRR
jgi:hypothetical protein